MSEGGIAICIFCVVVAVLAVVFVWLGEKQDKKEQKNENGEKPVADSEEVAGAGESVRYVHLTDGGKELARAARRGDDRRRGRKACSENNGVDAGD